MTMTPNSFLNTLQNTATQYHIRFPVFIEGSIDFSLLLINCCNNVTLVSNTLSDALPWWQVKKFLGQETGSLALDIRQGMDVEKLCALVGCVRGGALLFFILGTDLSLYPSRFYQRFMRFFRHPSTAYINEDGDVHLPEFCRYSTEETIRSKNVLTSTKSAGITLCQSQAIAAVEHVFSGHRRRPVLLIADRGRGKSAAMGMVAQSILQSGKKRILVTSPTISNVETVFKHAAANVPCRRENKYRLVFNNDSVLQFVAPDALLRELPKCDLLLVDEAAAIPMPMLDRMVVKYSRICFSSTEHGYEGTGRAFSTLFRTLLNEKTKGWKEIKLVHPVRWEEGDPLENWLFDAFLFDVEPTFPSGCNDIDIRIIDQDVLIQDEVLLRQLFGILVSTHYQTSPNDLMPLLDDDSMSILGAYSGKILVGALLAKQEGGDDMALASDVVMGKRRIRGHLLLQSLAFHTGIVEVLSSPLLRISRVAVLKQCQQQGAGSALISALERIAKACGTFMVGTSFGATPVLLRFWLSKGYRPARMGVQRNAASGTYSLQLVKYLIHAPHWLDDIFTLFSTNFLYQVSEQFENMDACLVAMLFTNMDADALLLLKPERRQVELFAHGVLGYDLVVGSLVIWFKHWLMNRDREYTYDLECLLLVKRLLQRQGWEKVARQYGCQGRRDTEMMIRDWISQHYCQ
ncbi:tRNA(Met) cytidine acetyltransferase TmcA [Candidatus Enterovibrio escicola]|uniref:DUF1726 domain-containing protein n=1 Tax=Candidatus Enterovibrio escicola TaxID=1927127 RepID=UPI001237D394|nr:DUF1726 domain-containing protein [Candidatus Enterovibrio escacola]